MCFLTLSTAASTSSNVVDLYNGITGTWTTAELSAARGYLEAASLGNVALFAGGFNVGGTLVF
jgi:hypothetical protein